MSLLRHTLEEERHEHIPTAGDPYGVPTGVVPRLDAAVVSAQQPAPRPKEFGAAIQKAIDEHLLIERKASAWDALQHILQQAPAQISPADVLRRMANLLGEDRAPDR